MSGADRPVDVAVDNDIIIKAACYGLTATFWPEAGPTCHLGVLGAARYVVAKRLARAKLVGGSANARSAVDALLSTASTLEPTTAEVTLATQLEVEAQRMGLSLDAGESQLIAMMIHREIPVLETGDKRAIESVELLLDQVTGLLVISGRVRCLEQIVLRCLAEPGASVAIAQAVCGEPDVDKALSICFRCFSPAPEGHALELSAIHSYIAKLRAKAPRVLMA
jgi:hypothetical protein